MSNRLLTHSASDSRSKAPDAHSPSIFEYFDYHAYLCDFYNRRKQSDRGFSHRSFLAAAGVPGTVYLFRVQNGQELDERNIPGFIRALGLGGEAARYFEALVRFQNEKKADLKERYCREMLAIRASRRQFRINDDRLKFFEKWYYPVVRELACMHGFTDNYTALANQAIPRISEEQAREAVGFLFENGFIVRNTNGTWRQENAAINTADEVRSVLLRKYHRKTLEYCIDALDDTPTSDREISSATISISRDAYLQIKHEIQRFRDRLLDVAAGDGKPAELVALAAFQLVPRSKLKKKRKNV